MSSKSLAYIRTHIITKGVIEEYKKLEKVGMDCFLFVNNSSNIVEDSGNILQEKEFFGHKVKCFLFNEEKFLELNLPYHSYFNENAELNEVILFNSDYPMYLVAKYFPDYDYYWQLEYDIFCNGTTYKNFFDNYNVNNSDLLITHLRTVD